MASAKEVHNSSTELMLNNWCVNPSPSCSPVECESLNNSNTTDILLKEIEADNITKDVEGNRKRDKRRLEKQLEINMTPKMTLLENVSPEGASSNTSRYGRARKLKIDNDFYPTDVALHMKSRMSKSPSKSPKKSVPKLSDTSSALENNVTVSNSNKEDINVACKLKIFDGVCATDTALHKKSLVSKSPSKSPRKSVAKLSATSPTLPNNVSVHESSTEDLTINNESNIHITTTVEKKIIHTPWNKQLDKIPLKVYVRKDLIQRKVPEEPCSVFTDIFSYPSSLYNTLGGDSRNVTSPKKEVRNEEVSHSKSQGVNKSPPRKYASKSCNGNRKLTLKRSEKDGPLIGNLSDATTTTKPESELITLPNSSRQEDVLNSSSTIDKADVKGKGSDNKKKNSKSPSCKAKNGDKAFKKQINFNKDTPVKEIQVESGEGSHEESVDVVEAQLNEDEKTCKWKLDELLWARVGSHPFWPCLVTRDPHSWRFVRKKKAGRSLIPVELYHVTFFGDSGRRSWLLANCLMKFEGLDHFNKTREELTPEVRKKDPKYCAAFEVRANKKDIWLSGVHEAEMLMSRPPELREEFFVTMYLSKMSNKSPSKSKKKTKSKSDKNADISLSDSMFDSLFNTSEDKQTNEKINTFSTVSSSEPKQSGDVIDFLDKSLNTLTAKTVNEKVMVQSHMDRWLLKFKKPVSEPSHTVDKDSVKVATDEEDKSIEDSSSMTKDTFGSKTGSVGNSKVICESDFLSKKKNGPKRRKSIAHSSDAHLLQVDVANKPTKTPTMAIQRRRKSIATSEFKESSFETSSDTIKVSSLDQASIKHPQSVVDAVVSESMSLSDCDTDNSKSSETKICKISSSRRRKSVANNVKVTSEEPLGTNSETSTASQRKSVANEAKVVANDSLNPAVCKRSLSRRRKSVTNDVKVVSKESLDANSETSTSDQRKSVTNDARVITKESLNTSVSKISPPRRRKSITSNDQVVNSEQLDICKTSLADQTMAVASSVESHDTSQLVHQPSGIKVKSLARRRKSIACTSVSHLTETDNEEMTLPASRISTLRRRKTIDCRNMELDVSNTNCVSVCETIRTNVQCTEGLNEKEVSTPSTPKVLSVRRKKSIAVSPSIQIPQQDNNGDDVKEQYVESKKNKVPTSKYDDTEFQEFLEFKRDALLEENPNLTDDCVISYLYKTWQYGESKKTDDMKSADDYCLVKGMADESIISEPKKQRKRNKDAFEEKENDNKPNVTRENSRRKSNIKSYFLKDSDSSDVEDTEIPPSNQQTQVIQQKTDEPIDVTRENIDVSNADKKSNKSKENIQQEIIENGQTTEIESGSFDYYMESLRIDKPSIFKGLVKEKVCVICEKPRRLTKCSGSCGEMYHVECVMKQQAEPASEGSGRYKKKRKRGRRVKNSTSNERESGDESQLDETTIEDDGGVVKPILNGDVELCLSPSKNTNKESDLDVPQSIVTDAQDFESQLERTMKEMLNNGSPESDLDISSTSMEVDNEWSGVKAGECVIVDVVEHKDKDTHTPAADTNTDNVIMDTFKCNDCLKSQLPLCFACRSTHCSKNNSEDRQKCNVLHCNKFYHMECLQTWPQTKYSTTCPTKYQKKSQVLETLSCPRHVCHTCISDDPRGNRSRFTSDKLARCVRCPATYHSLTKCIPAGTKLLTASHILCPRHNDNKVSKIPYHVNTAWCFICAKGGSLICCETCPTSFHAECLKISAPEGSYICEECETGRLPLYEELVWVKLGHYRWWPALVLHPSDVPPNIAALPHASNQFAVRFFGDYDHFWVNSGRVFPYQEDDTGRASSRKSSVDSRFLTALKQAKEAYNIIKSLKKQDAEKDELSSNVLPPQYVKLKVNRPVGGAAANYKNDKTCAQKCECDPNSDNPCAPDTDCINRMLLLECSPSVCAARERCCNQAFEKRQYPPLQPRRTQHRGWGLKALADIKKGDFVIEYVGEIIDEAEFQRRMTRKRETRDENYYFLTLDKDRMIDAGPKGNVARFMNHSCEPNCETQKWTVNGDTRVGLFALQDIPSGSEVTFNYNLMCADDDKKKCMCGAKRCAGFIGAKFNQDEVTPKNPKKSNVKRKYNKKSIDNTQTNSPSTVKSDNSKNTSLSSRKRKSLPLNKPVEEDGIEKDWKEINQAASLADDREKEVCKEDAAVVLVKLDMSNEESKKENLPSVKTPAPLNSNKTVQSSPNQSVDMKCCNGYEKAFAQFIQNNDKQNSDKYDNVGKAEKRKLSPNSDAFPKNKRPRSNSVHFSDNVTCIQSNGNVLKSPLPRVNRTYTIDGDHPSLTESRDTTPSKGKRGRPRKSAVQNEI